MRRERIKTVLLAFLVVMNFVLGSKILIDKKLWSGGYNFFSAMGNLNITKLYTNIVNYFTDSDSYKTTVLSPIRIIINTDDQTTRISLNSADYGYDALLNEANTIIKAAFSAGESDMSQITKKELYSSLTSGSVYLDFSRNVASGLYCGLFGAGDYPILNTVKEFSDVIIVHSPRTLVYFADTDSETFYKINVSKNSDELKSAAEECEKRNGGENSPIINYSFDLKFDSPFGTQKTTLNPFIQVYSTVDTQPVIYAKNPVSNSSQGFINDELIKEILKTFDINYNAMRRYTETGGTLVFVENNAILKIEKNGFLEYSAIDGGIELSSAQSDYANLVSIAHMALNINRAVGNDYGVSLVQSAESEKNTFTFDYTVGGLPVIIDGERAKNAVEATVENGRLTSYRQIIRKYGVLNSNSSPREFFTALDNVIADYSEYMNEIYIDKMYIGYTDSLSDGEITADWIVKVDNIVANE